MHPKIFETNELVIKQTYGDIESFFDKQVRNARRIIYSLREGDTFRVHIDRQVDEQYPNFRPLFMAKIDDIINLQVQEIAIPEPQEEYKGAY